MNEPRIVTIPYCPRFPQTVVHKELEAHRFNVFVGHRRLGKTVMFLNDMVKRAAKNRLMRPRYAYIAPYLKQAKMIAWDYLKRYAMAIPGTKANESELSVEIPSGAVIRLFGADNPDAIRGTYFDGVDLDEYGHMKPGFYQTIIRPTLADRRGWCNFGGTPKGQNEFYEIYNLARKMMAEGNKDWWAGLYRADETGVLPKDELDQLRATMADRVFRQEFLCDFTAESDNVLITIDVVSAACRKVIQPHAIAGSPRIIGVDVARFGDDRSVIFRRQGLQAFSPVVLTHADNMAVVGRVAQEIEQFQPDAVFIDAGRGEGVIDRLRQLGHKRIIEVNFGGEATTSAVYKNKRTEMWDLMLKWLESGGSLPNLPELKADLVVPTYDFDPANRMRLASKEKIKEDLGKSPDLADALALTFAFPVKARSTDGLPEQPEFYNGSKAYDVLAY